jgi:hypothetical protein
MKPPDLNLGQFLTQLAVDDNLRVRFENAPKATLDSVSPALRASVKTAILKRKGAKLFNLFNIANQSSGGDVASPAKKSAKSAKKTAKKVAKKSSAKK